MDTVEKSRVTVFGISGCSCSGKTSLALVLKKLLPGAVIVHQDEYYKLDSLIPKDPDTGYDNWDTPKAIDMELFFKSIKEAVETSQQTAKSGNKIDEEVDKASKWASEQLGPEKLNQLNFLNNSMRRYVIVEGFLYFHDPTFLKLLDGAVLTWSDYPSLIARRNSRPGYETKEGFWTDPPNYFEQVVWPSFLKFYSPFIEKTHEFRDSRESLQLDDSLFVSPLAPELIKHEGLDWTRKFKVIRTDKKMTLSHSSLEIANHILTCL